MAGRDWAKVRRFQYTAIDDATKARAIQIHEKHNQDAAIPFVDYVVARFPFRIHTTRTDNGHEFEARFHWHVEDLGVRHSYLKPQTRRLNGKVGRSPRPDQEEFYQLLQFKDDVDMEAKLKEWENFYNLYWPDGAIGGAPHLKFFARNHLLPSLVLRGEYPCISMATACGGPAETSMSPILKFRSQMPPERRLSSLCRNKSYSAISPRRTGSLAEIAVSQQPMALPLAHRRG